MRVRGKRLRYVLEFVGDATGQAGQRLTKALTELQDILGAHQDAVIAADFVHDYVEEAGHELSPGTTLALGALVSAQLQRAETHRNTFAKAWRRFKKRTETH